MGKYILATILIFSAVGITLTLKSCQVSSNSYGTYTQKETNYHLKDFDYNEELLDAYKLFQFSNDSAHIYFKLNPNETIAIGEPNERTLNVNQNISITDTRGTVVYQATSPIFINESEGRSTQTITFPLNKDSAYVIRFDVLDMNKENYQRVYFTKGRATGLQEFMCVQRKGQPVLNTSNYKSETVSIYSPINADDSLVLYMFSGAQKPASPPYSTLSARNGLGTPDTVVMLKFDSKGQALIPNFSQQHIYYISSWPINSDGLLISYFTPNYPRPKEFYELKPSLRYLLSREEYKELEESRDPRDAFEKVWLNFAGQDKERAKKLIQKYYGRVVYANKHFTSTKEGWKTDRGMVYTIYGKPENIIYKSNEERWEYSADQGVSSISFIFYKKSSSVSNNDYYLVRNSLFRNSWYDCVNHWRSGNPLN